MKKTIAGLCLVAAAAFGCQSNQAVTTKKANVKKAKTETENKTLVCEFRKPFIPIPAAEIFWGVMNKKLYFAFKDAQGQEMGGNDNCMILRPKGTKPYEVMCSHIKGDTVITPIKGAKNVTSKSFEGTSDTMTSFELATPQGHEVEVKTNAPCKLMDKDKAPKKPIVVPKTIDI